jgi:hypothetical protein
MLESLSSNFSLRAVPEKQPQDVLMLVDDQFDRRTIDESFAKGFNGVIRVACRSFSFLILSRSMFAWYRFDCFHIFLLVKKKDDAQKLHSVVLENQAGENAGL